MRLRYPLSSHSTFGDAVIVLFLLTQAADGVLTYVGVTTMGLHIEANPLLLSLMSYLGEGVGVTAAKVVAGGLGITLHLVGVHRIIAVLTGIYIVGAILPWAGLLIYM